MMPSQYAINKILGGRTTADSSHQNKAVYVHSHGGDVSDIEAPPNSEKRFPALLDLVGVAVCGLDRDGNVFIWNRAAEQASGYSREEVVGHGRIWGWLYPDERYLGEVTAKVRTIMEKKLYEENLQTKIRRKDGDVRIVSWNFHILFDQNNCAAGSIALGRDLTNEIRMYEELERHSKQLETLVTDRTRDLRENEERLYAIIHGSPEGIVVIDSKGDIAECNQAAIQLYGSHSRDQLIGRNLAGLVAKGDRDTAAQALEQLATSDRVTGLRLTMVKNDGRKYPAELSLGSVRDADGCVKIYVAIVRDLTEQNEIQEQLRKAERLAVIGETVAMVAHDLRNPLQTIAVATSLLRNESLTTQERDEILHLTDDGLKHANEIVTELLEYSREIHLNLEEVTPRAITKSALEAVKVPETIKVQNEALEQPVLPLDTERMRRVFINLISNAVDAMPDGGTLTLTTKELDGFVEMNVSDTGTGVDQRIMEDLWKPLKTTKSKGMGLGLAICKRIVEAHSGSIELESTLGRGTTFTLKLPIKPGRADAADQKPP